MTERAAPLRLLHLEDDPHDAELVAATLAAEGLACEVTRVETREAFEAALVDGAWDLILADYQLPSFDGIRAQTIAAARRPDVPFIFVSGTFGEEIAIERLKAGATDYVLKDRLTRLVPCVVRALREAEDRRERLRAEAELRRLNADLEQRVAARTAELQAILDHSPTIIYLKDLEGRYLLVNRRFETLFRADREAVIGKTDLDLFPPVLAEMYRANDAKVLATGQPLEAEEIAAVHGTTRVYSSIKFLVYAQGARPLALCGIAIDITEKKIAADEIKMARLEAEQANRAKTDFLSRMSHDLRTPLNAILGFAQLLDSDELSPGQRDCADQILTAGDHLLGLINEVLDIARIEAGELSLSPEPVAVADVVARTLQLIAPLASRRGIKVRADDATARSLYVLADRQRLSQILLNLLSNAVKYNREAGEVVVAFRASAVDRVRISVRDTGPGISAEKLTRLFRPFDRLGAEASGVEGTGLGLTVARELARAMGGDLGVESVVGKGSTFWVDLPLTEQRLVEAADPQAEALDRRLERRDVHGRVLYVDDNRSNIRLLERVLERRPGVVLESAALGREGLEKARARPPDLVLLDLHLPDMDGADVLRDLRLDERTRHVPVAILSADATSHGDDLREAGAIAYLTKPLQIAGVLKLVDETVSRGGRRQP